VELQSLLQNLELLVEELINPGGNKHFISVNKVNELTFEMRRFVDKQLSPDPVQYMPILMEQFIVQFKTLNAIKKRR
jgi:antitoxin component HigA of HigAB toxin-antitoxin module